MVTKSISSFKVAESISPEPVAEGDFFPDSANLYPKFPEKIGKSAVEVWLFDATAEDGSTSITISFFRDALAAPAGFRIAVNATWADGAIWSSPVIFPNSIITSDGPGLDKGTVVGVWQTDSDNSNATFEVSADLSTAQVVFNVPGKIMGSLLLKSLGFASLPKTAAEAEAGPRIYWMRPIAMADAKVDITLTSKTPEGQTTDRRLVMGAGERAFGGVDRSWEALGWTRGVTDSVFLRAKAGPYTLQMMMLVGKAEKSYPITASARLYWNSELICAPRTVIGVDEFASQAGDGDSLAVTRVFAGEGLPAIFRHRNVGYRLEFNSVGATEAQRWVFNTVHQRAWYCKPTGPPGPDGTGTGSSGFLVSVEGGFLGAKESFHGWGYEGQVVLPE
ncbi:hypothetical protein VFPPC_14837 [Pochonia chlamydosporia 170]|uniref:Uncharacterized protein n=1 Tax=Pochonia chlamydosporia 170 TaxID=1380566 RepID=A0A179FJ38_METCM|nr:hypothetical protein VFPPC_14837 [Pochonia chlamydosporia 170]OAQ65534.1 hypothetical protein VFPPC_14837 [Pochonia chlamydosporia 170]